MRNVVTKDWKTTAPHAEGLTENESAMLARLIAEYDSHIVRNQEKLDYYNDNVDVSEFDSRVPKELQRVKVAVGACSKSVHMLARRSIFDGFTIEGDSKKRLNEIMDANEFAIQYAMAVPSQLVHGCGVWTVSPGDVASGEPRAVTNFHSLMDAAAVWDFRKRRVKYGMVIEDVAAKDAKSAPEPVCIVMHTDTHVITIERDPGAPTWTATRMPHAMGQPMMVAMRYQPTFAQPLGRSRVSKTMRSLTVQYMLATYNLMAHDQYSAIPLKYLLGLSDDQFDALVGNEARVDAKSILLATTNEDGTTPSAGTFDTNGGVYEHTQVLENIAQRMAAESDLPVSAFGVLGNNYTSSDALNAASHDLVILAESLNKTNRAALVKVAQMALCVAQDKPWSKLTEEERAVTVHFRDPSMLSASQIADAMMKICTTLPEFGGTDVYWERMGFNEDERRRVKNEIRANGTRNALNALFGGGEQ